jgi:uncharacterized protein YidB (DUF937 family)
MGLDDLIGKVTGSLGGQGGDDKDGGSDEKGGGGLGGMLGNLGGLGGLANAGNLAKVAKVVVSGLQGKQHGGGGGGLGSLLGGSGAGGMLPGLLEKLTQGGLGAKAQSWVGTGDNQPVSGQEVESALGADTVEQVAQQAGVSHDEARDGLAQVLPHVVDHLTPEGKVASDNEVQDRLANLGPG